MTLMINLSPAEERTLRTAALNRGVAPEELARLLIASLHVGEPIFAEPGAPRVSDELRAMGLSALREHSAGRTVVLDWSS